jgi:transcriptional regulator with XRE-family HTH domain
MDGEKIKEIRERLEMTQQEFAENIGVALSSVANWENKRREPSRLAVQSIEELLNIKGREMDWIIKSYNVPAKVGGRVNFKGKPGTILGTQDQYIIIQLDGEKTKGLYHPTWEIEYLEAMENK